MQKKYDKSCEMLRRERERSAGYQDTIGETRAMAEGARLEAELKLEEENNMVAGIAHDAA